MATVPIDDSAAKQKAIDPSVTEKLQVSRATYAENRRRFDAMLPDLHRVRGASGNVRGAARSIPHISRAFSFGVDEEQAASRHRPRLIDPLLQQAAMFVNRVLSEEPAYRQMLIDQKNLSLDIEEFQALDQINSDEVAAGLFKVPYWEASAALQSDLGFRDATSGLADWVAAQSVSQRSYAAWATENSQQPTATGWESKLAVHKVKLLGGFDPSKTSAPGGLSGYAGTEGFCIGGLLSYAIADYSYTYQEKQLRASLAPAAQRSAAVIARVAYLQADSGFRERRKVAAHNKLVSKLQAIRRPNGPLNYADRISSIEERAALDLREAYGRMWSISKGLPTVYGIAAPPLPIVPRSEDGRVNERLLEETVLWLRSVSLTTQDIAMRDQDYVVSVSLRRALGDGAFRAGSRDGLWEFDVDARIFDGLRFLRLRGVSLEVDSSSDEAFAFTLTPPRASAAIMKVGDAPIPTEQEVGDCWIGRARSHKSQRDPEIGGTRVLLNASPIGKWTLVPAPTQNTNDATDIRVNMHLLVQAA